jgi:tetrahydromethanopterin S-methyltransferase subunit A
MIPRFSEVIGRAMDEALEELSQSVEAKKCWSCGCFRGALDAIERSLKQCPPAELASLLENARARLRPPGYDCLGCEVCHPPAALTALERTGILEAGATAVCHVADPAREQEGWPALPGEYRVLRYRAPVAVCTLTAEELVSVLAAKAPATVALIGALQTENLGIERVITNVNANPNVRFLVLCGPDSKRAVGHLPGASLLALARNGMEGNRRIIEAPGKRPILANVSPAAVEHFRRTVEVLDLVGTSNVPEILRAVDGCGRRDPGPGEPFAGGVTVEPIRGHPPVRAVLDPAGFFVVYVDRRRKLLCLEHYRNEGVLSAIVEGEQAADVYYPAIEKGFVSRLDHAAYLGRELAKAERALATGEEYVQDAAPERPAPSKPLLSMACGASSPAVDPAH